MSSPWIKTHRKITEWGWYKDSQTFHLFMHLVLKANYKDTEWRGVPVKRGQLVTGRKQLSSETGISEQTIRTILNRLKSTNELTIKPTNKFSLITICNYCEYQSGEIENNQQINQQSNQQLTSNQPATNQQLTTSKNIKKDKKEKKEEFMPHAEANIISGRCPEKYHPLFEEFWKVYPARNGKKNGKRKAFEKWWKIVRDGIANHEFLKSRIIILAQSYGEFPKDAVVWLNGRCWEDETHVQPKIRSVIN